MEPISTVVLSLVLGAAAIASKEVVSSAVKDAYTTVKTGSKTDIRKSRSSCLSRRGSRSTGVRRSRKS
jgi:hypothetical protein